MQRTRRDVLASGMGALGIAAVAGCLGTDEEPEDTSGAATDDDDQSHDDEDGQDDHDDHGHIHVDEFEILDRDTDDVAAYVHGDHWHGDPLEIPDGDYRSLGASVTTEDGEEIDFDDGYELVAEVVDGAAALVDVDHHGDHVHVSGTDDGLTELIFHVEIDDELVYEASPLEVDVGDHDHDDDDNEYGSVHELTIYDRDPDPHESVATHHDDHWDGELPDIPVGENGSLGGEFVDEDGNEIPVDHDEEYEFVVHVADDADEDVVEIDPDEHWHGDHVHVYGETAGETEVVFSLWHDDHADWESEPIPVEVVE